MPGIRVVHTSNLHLGRRFPDFARETEEMRIQDINNVFQDLAGYVIKNEVALVLIAGDLFDKANPKRETISRVLSVFGDIHEKLPDTRIIITPGREELVRQQSGDMECILNFFEHLSYVKVIGGAKTPQSVRYEFGGTPVVVSSCRADLLSEKSASLKRIPRPGEGEVGIFLLSSYLRRGSVLEIDDELLAHRIIPPLKDRGYSYLALGGRHEVDIVESGGFNAIFSGGLERFDFERDRGRKCFISFIVENGAIAGIETVRSRARKMEFINITCNSKTTAEDIEEAASRFSAKRTKSMLLYIALNGQLTFEQYKRFESSELLDELREQFMAVHIDNRLFLIDSEMDYNFDALRVNSPADEFMRTVKKEMDEAGDRGEEVRLLEELLQMGLEEIEKGI